MARLVLAWLDVAEGDRRWIENLRLRHDPQHAIVAAHVTLVFPFDSLGAEDAVHHAAAVAARTAPISFRLNTARAVRDAGAPRSHVFLLPEQGAAEIIDLHDRLYAGPLADQLRADIPFIPHVTVAAKEFAGQAEDLARGINDARVDIPGKFSAIELVDFDGAAVEVIATFALATR